MAKSYYVSNDDVEQVEMAPGVLRRTLGTTDEVMICEFQFQAGCAIPTHEHPHHQAGYVISGQVEFNIDGDVKIVKVGDSYGIPGGVPHSARCIEAGVIMEVFSPAREEYR